MTTPARRLVGKLAFAAIGSLLALVLVEVVLRIATPDGDVYRVWQPHLEVTFHPDPKGMPGVDKPARFAINALGLRGEELTDQHDFRILTVGGSTTECNFLDHDDAWPQHLMNVLAARQDRHRVWVGNAARSGLNARHNAVQLERLLPQLPRIDLVVVLPGCNDLSVRLAKDSDYDPRFLEREGAVASLMPRCFQVFPRRYRQHASWLESLALGRLVADVKQRVFPPRTVVDDAGHAYDVWREHRRNAPVIRPRLPDLTSALAEYRSLLTAEIEACRAAGAEILFLTQPSLWRADLPPELERLLWFGGVGEFQEVPGCEYYSVAALAEGMARYNDAVLALAAEQGVPCLDLAALLPRDGSVFYDDVHFTTAGSHRIGELVADRILTLPPFN